MLKNQAEAMMNVQIDVDRSLIEQFERCFKLRNIDGGLYLDPAIGDGGPVRHLVFPGEMEFYHFPQTRFAVPIAMRSVNPVESDWFLIHINLSNSMQRKIVAGRSIDFHRRLPIGLLIYGPGLEIETPIPPNVDTELASIHFNSGFLDTYFEDWRERLDINKNLTYEDLDYRLERKLGKALESIRDKIRCHAAVLDFMSLVFDKLASRDRVQAQEKLRSKEINGLFRACACLRDPLAEAVPSINQLAALANMGTTKFKSTFRQVFGCAPMQYRNNIRMEYAREMISSNARTPTEISYLLGYSHPSNFTAAYKKHFGDVPSAKTQQRL